MMFAIMMGSLTFQKFEGWPMFNNNKERLLIPALGCASISFSVMAYDHAASVRFSILFCEEKEFLFYPEWDYIASDTSRGVSHI